MTVGPYIRILLAWLIAMQPMLGAYATAHAARAPIQAELCRGTTLPAETLPGAPADYLSCCVAACAHAAAPPSDIVALQDPQPVFSVPATIPLVREARTNAPTGLKLARAPPVALSTH